MDLDIQIKSLVFSFLFGIYFNILIIFFDRFLYKVRIRFQVINSFIFCIINAIIYFFILKRINNGIIHLYFILSIILGIMFEQFVINKLFIRFKYWYDNKKI